MKLYKITSAILFLTLPILGIASETHGEDHHKPKQSEDHHSNGHGDHESSSDVGTAGDVHKVNKAITVKLLDSMKLDFDYLSGVNHGDTVQFKVTNVGKIRHEFSIGSEEEQKKHRTMMRQMPNMVHEDDNSVTVEPGETKSIVWHFNGDENIVFACNIPGHTEAGMIERKSLH